MATIHKDLNDEVFHPGTETEEITAWAVIGDGQPSAYLIFLDQDMKGVDKKALLGNKGNVMGKAARFSATVTDVMSQTNWTSFTAYVQEGRQKPVLYGPYQEEVPNDKDTIVYSLQIQFK